ncbi:hypothetical protein D8M09_02635 [Enterobacter sp. R1(2018)]|nr:hypothetical protein D8M09_02635 [Enterobacter sp. R1(2018)]
MALFDYYFMLMLTGGRKKDRETLILPDILSPTFAIPATDTVITTVIIMCRNRYSFYGIVRI